MNEQPEWVDRLIAAILRIGVLSSVTAVTGGLIVAFLHHPEYMQSATALGPLIDPSSPFPDSIRGVLAGCRAGHGQSLIMIGLLLLIATPVARVLVSIGIFAIERDRLYVGITSAVFALLLLSFAIGAAG